MTYKEFIENRKADWIGTNVIFQGKEYQVVDVDYNGMLVISMPAYYCESYTSDRTAVPIMAVKEKR